MTDAQRNPNDRELWPRVTVIAGWVYSVGSIQPIQMGFSLSPSWGPPPNFEREANRASEQLVQRMHFPATLEWWLLEQFRSRHLTSVSIQRALDRWRIHLNLSVRDYEMDELATAVESLLAAANLPSGSHGQRVEELNSISLENPDFTESDAFFHWLGDRIKLAVQAIFDAGRG